MPTTDEQPFEMSKIVARSRVILSVVAMLAVYVDPAPPELLPRLGLGGGWFTMDARVFAAMVVYLCVGVALDYALRRRHGNPSALAVAGSCADVVFAAGIAAVTEGISSPFYAFFVFAVAASGIQFGFRWGMGVVAVSVGLYLSLILVSREGVTFYIMRPVYLAIVGYLIAYLGQRRLDLQARVNALEQDAQRTQVARALHDGCLQTLAAVGLRLEACRVLGGTGHHDRMLAEIDALQVALAAEHDTLRSYVRDLARVPAGDSDGRVTESPPQLSVTAELTASPLVVDEVLQIVREAVANVRRHSGARAASVAARSENGHVLLAVDDDGVGLGENALPWSIASRVDAAGGSLRIESSAPGTHLRISLPGT